MILKYYLVNVIPQIKLEFIHNKNEIVQEFRTFISENFVDLWACADSEEYEILDILIGKQSLQNKKQTFLLKSMSFCDDKYLKQEF